MGRKRLLWQLYPSYLLIMVVSLLAVTRYASDELREFYHRQIAAGLESRAHLLEQSIGKRLDGQQYADIDALCKKLGPESSTRITVILASGEVVGDSEELPSNMDNHGNRPEVADAREGHIRPAIRYSYTVKKEMMYVALPLRQDDRIVAFLRTSIPVTSLDGPLRTIQWRIAAGGLVVALLAAVVGWLVARRIGGPLEQLRQGAERFAQGDLTHKLPVPTSLEIGSLAEAMNSMAAELDDRIRTLLRERNEREAILTSMVEGVMTVNSQRRLTSMNRAAGRLLDVDAEKAQGRDLQEIIRNPTLHELVAEVLSRHAPLEAELLLHNGPERYLHAQGTVLRDPEGEGIGALVVLHDVTRLRWLENVRRDFVANVSHELRTPITSIKGFVETLLDGGVQDPKDAERFLTIVAAQADRLNDIIEDLLTLSRVEEESENTEVTREPGPICDVLHQAVGVCELKAQQKEIHIEVKCDPDLEANINAALLEQAVINLIDNAVKYSANGEAVQVEAVRDGAEIVIRVSDHGCGISQEHLPRIFERFYRVDKARSRKLGGTGLGLAIVKHICQAHGGRATVRSTLGEGSTFSIHLPA